jgi:hypothetical protein
VYGDDVEVDYRGYEVTVENLIRVLTGWSAWFHWTIYDKHKYTRWKRTETGYCYRDNVLTHCQYTEHHDCNNGALH